MAAKPAQLCRLKKGQLIDVQEGFVDTFNWMVDFINNLKCDKDTGLKIDTTISDKPVIKLADAGKKKEGQEVVVNVEYDTADHTFRQYKRKLASTVKFADNKQDDGSTVFTATEINI